MTGQPGSHTTLPIDGRPLPRDIPSGPRSTHRCTHCASPEKPRKHLDASCAFHKSKDCSLAGDDDPDLAKRMKAVESTVVAFSSSSGNTEAGRSQRSAEICRLFNEKRCRFRNCKYRHVCFGCKGFHAAPDCPTATLPAARAANGKPGPMRRESVFSQVATPY